jgi:hypothetical protein
VSEGARASGLAALLACALACGEGVEPAQHDAGQQDATSEEPSACSDAEARLGHRVCVHALPNAATWDAISFETAAVDQGGATTYLVPARDDARLPALFVDAHAFESPAQSLHFKFLTESFPELALLTYEEYLELVLDPERREWFGGSLTELLTADGEPTFGFTIADRGDDPSATITCDQFERVHDTLDRLIDVGEVVVVPGNDLQREVLAGCGVPVVDPALALDYEPYTKAKRCGTLRRFTLAELAIAERDASFGWQDVLVVDEAPLDLETVIAGIVTGTRQGELSHLNVRSATRGTPNCYVKDGYQLLAEWEGQLVQLECGPASASVVPISVEELEACNAGLRPEPIAIAPADLDATELVPLLELPTATEDERRAARSRFGSKGANLAILYQRIETALQLIGFLVPLHYHDAFLREGSWEVDLGDGLESVSFHDTIERWLEDPSFTTDGAVRRERLTALRSAMREAPCDPALLAELEAQILQTFGSAEVHVRFRSSSNAEDALQFNGAGLYDSTSVCLADDQDDDTVGPCRCDPDKPNEDGVCAGLTRVWASLWNMKAFEERSWYGIDHRQVGMGVLIDTRSKGELANIVAFSGNPLLRGDKRYLINAQLGELDVVSALPGVWPESDLLTLEAGAVTAIERTRGSTELPKGEWVLDDARLEQLGAALSNVADVYPMDDEVPVTTRVLLDTEWKVLSDGRLVIKQVRPFLPDP